MEGVEVGTLSQLASLAAPLPPAPEGDVFTPEQWTTLLAICDVFVPTIQAADGHQKNAVTTTNFDETVAQFESYLPDNAGKDLVTSYLQESFSQLPEVQEILRRKLIQFVPQDAKNGLAFVLSALNSKAGSLLLTGSTTLIHQQDLPTRTIIVCKWAQSYLPPLRTVHRTFALLSRQVWLQNNTTLPKMLDFPSTPANIERNPSYAFKFHDFTSNSTPTSLSADAIIIGSGCGAGVVASTLSRAGLKVLILEKSYHFPSTYFPMNPASSADEHLFENGGIIISDDSSMFVKAGSTLGGGGTINWSASLQPPHHIRTEWSSFSGLPLFTSPSYQSCLDYVCDRMGVSKSDSPSLYGNITHSTPNSVLLEGARRLGLSTITVPQNTGGRKHDCGYCSAGCPSCAKQGPANLWLPDAAEHGAEFIQGCFVDKIIFSPTNPSVATGVSCSWTSQSRTVTRTLTLNAPRIIVSSGTLHSPLVLQRSGLTNPHIGKNLHLHPVGILVATYPQRINPWEGAILTSAVTALTNTMPSTPQNGPMIECLYSVPGFGLQFMPFHPAYAASTQDAAAAALDWKVQAAKWSHSTAWICIQRDIDSGSVYSDPHNPRMVRVKYTASHRDRAGVLKGQVTAARMAYVMGAKEIDVLHPNVDRFVRKESASDETNDAAFEIWLQDVDKRGLLRDPEAAPLGSAHQMGTCRMSGHPEKGVVDGHGKVWGTQNVYVADASVLPSAPGVNPMVSCMGVSEWVARGIAREFEEEGGYEQSELQCKKSSGK